MFTNNEQDQGPVECRICHSRTTRDLILSPCLCKGSMGFVHTRCLEKWLNISSHNFCELCSYKFEVNQVRKYSLLRSIRVWFCRNQSSVYKTIFFIVISIINLLLITYVWMLWFLYFITSFHENMENKTEGEDYPELLINLSITIPQFVAYLICLTVLTVLSVKYLCVEGYTAIKFQYHTWNKLWKKSVKVKLVLDKENYKIKANLEELKEISLNNAQDKTPNKYFSEENNCFNKLSQDPQKIHNSRKDSTDNIVATTKPSLHDEIGNANIEPDKTDEKLEYNLQEKANDSIHSLTQNFLSCSLKENDSQNINLKYIPEVHKEYNNKLE